MSDKIIVDMDIAIDPDRDTVTLSIFDVPVEMLAHVLQNIGQESWRQNILDGINGARVAQDMGMACTERTFCIGEEE